MVKNIALTLIVGASLLAFANAGTPFEILLLAAPLLWVFCEEVWTGW